MILQDELTEREVEVLQLMGDGFTNREISERLVLSLETIRWYTKQIYSKLGVHSRTQAILKWQEINSNTEAEPVEETRTSIYTNLPEYGSSFIGRSEDIANIQSLFEQNNARLITITGAGGMGKTRLAVETARQAVDLFPDGIYFVPCELVLDTNGITLAMADIMQIPGNTTLEQIATYLENKKALLILDTYEHLVDYVEFITDLLAETQHLKILITSRNALNLQIEWVRSVEPLGIPSKQGPLQVEESVALFEDRARRFIPNFSVEDEAEAVGEICRLVNGMPLAIELATTWLKMLTCSEIVSEIQKNIDFLSTNQRDIDQRHQSIRAVFNQSWNLLNQQEQKVLGRLAVLRGGFSLQTARQVAHASLEIISSLVDKSLIRYDASHNQDFHSAHYHLHSLLGKYAEEKMIDLSSKSLTSRTGIFMIWSAFVNGDFERVEELVDKIFNPANMISSDLSVEAFGLALSGTLEGLSENYAECLQMCEVSLNISLQQDRIDPIAVIFARLGIAIAGCGTGHYYNAQQSIAEALVLAEKLDTPAFSLLCLPISIIIKVHHAEFEEATQLLAFFQEHPANSPTWLQRWSLLQHLEENLLNELGEDVFDECWENGRTLTLQAVLDSLIADE